jgi:uncharacterized protein (TIGR03437 family)
MHDMKKLTMRPSTQLFSRLLVLSLLLFALGSGLVFSVRGALMQVPAGGYEGDVSARTDAGKGSVGIADWVQIGRFVAGTDAAKIGGEFQRADVAPKATKGDGYLTMADWVQAGRYALGQDALVAAGGPTTPATGFPTKPEAARDMRIVNLGISGSTLNLAIEYEAVGNENAFGFSVNFDPMVLGSPTAATGSGASGATLLFNSLQAAQGKLGFALALPSPNVILAGVRQLATLSFTILKVGVNTQLSFGNQPVAIEIVGADASILPAPNTATPTTVAIDNPVPTLTSLDPTSAVISSAAFTLTVNGTNFNATSIVRWNGADRTTTLKSATQLEAAITMADIAAAGSASVTVFNPAPGGGTTTALSFAINNPVPTLFSLDPTNVVAGSAGFTLMVNGTGFFTGSVVQVNSVNRTTTFGSPTKLSINLTTEELAAAGALSIRVVNPAPGGGATATQTFTINNPVPALTSLSQTTIATGSDAFTLTVTGSNFVNTSKVRWNGAERATTFVSSTQLQATILKTDLETGSAASVTVVNPTPGGGTSNALTFTVTNPTPAITSLDPPSTFATLPAFALMVNGTGFVPNSVVRWNGPNSNGDRTTTFVSNTKVTAAISAADIAAEGTAVVTVFSPTPGGGTSNAVNFVIEKLTGYEGDVSPRPFGNNDGKVTVSDWVQLGRFYIGLDKAENGSEFQRADCAPKDTKGDGRITISDWVQAGRYSAGLDAVVFAGGPTQPPLVPQPTVAAFASEATPRVLRAMSANFRRDQLNMLPIELDAQGNENALAFTLNYDPKLLRFAAATLGAGASGATLSINHQARAGRVGLALAMPVGQVINAGTRAVLNVRFVPLAGDGNVTTQVSFGDHVVAREMADALAKPLPAATYLNATINLSGRAAAHVIAANYVGDELAADSIASAFGANLAVSSEGVTTKSLPTTLGGTRVRITDSKGAEREAALFFVSPTQVNYQIPAGTAEGVATITITNRDGIETKGFVYIGRVAPGIFSADATGTGVAAADVVYVRSDGSQVWERAARFDATANRFVATPIVVSGDAAYLILYGTGLRHRRELAQVQARVDGVAVAVEYAGAQGGYVGLDQLNLKLPPSLEGRGEVTVELLVEGKAANPVRIAIR